MSGQMPISTETYRSGPGAATARRNKRVQMVAMYLIGVAIGLVILGMIQQGRRQAALQTQAAAERERQATQPPQAVGPKQQPAEAERPKP